MSNIFTLKIFEIISIILENGMFILGVSLPKRCDVKKIISIIIYYL